MVSFDLSTTNIVLTGAVVALLIFFIALLIKLNPSTEKKENLRPRIEVDEQEPLHSPTVLHNHQSSRIDTTRIEAPEVAEKPMMMVGSTIGGGSTQTRQVTQGPPVSYKDRETPRQPEKPAATAKTEASSAVKDCAHHYGYLHTFPKNSPIPDECFGCEKIVDCLVNSKKSAGKNERLR